MAFVYNFPNMGMPSYKNQTFNELTANGMVSVHDCTNNGKTNVNGNLDIFNSTFKGLFNANASVTCNKGHFHALVTIKGMLTTKDCEFRDDLRISTKALDLKSSRVIKNLVMQRCSDAPSQTVTLSDGTVVQGSIIFDAGNGKVRINDGCRLVGGVQGGVIEGNAKDDDSKSNAASVSSSSATDKKK